MNDEPMTWPQRLLAFAIFAIAMYFISGWVTDFYDWLGPTHWLTIAVAFTGVVLCPLGLIWAWWTGRWTPGPVPWLRIIGGYALMVGIIVAIGFIFFPNA